MTDRNKPWWDMMPRVPGFTNLVIDEEPLVVIMPGGFHKKADGVKALVLDTEILNVVGSGFHVVQPKDLVAWAREIRKHTDSMLTAQPLRSWSMREHKVLGVTFTHSTWPLRTADGRIDLKAVAHVVSWNGGGGREVYVDIEHDGLVYPVDRALYVAPSEGVQDTADYVESFIRQFGRRAQDMAETPASLKTITALIETLWPKPGDGAGQKSQTRWKTRKDEILTIWGEHEPTAWGTLTAINGWAQCERKVFRFGEPIEKYLLARAQDTLLGQARRIGLVAYEFLRT